MPNGTEKAFELGKADGIANEFGKNNSWKSDPRCAQYFAYVRGFNEGKENAVRVTPSLHIDDWLDNRAFDSSAEEHYARWWFEQRRWSAVKQVLYYPFMKDDKLFCTYEGKRYRVTGCSRLGDVWLNSDWNAEDGYTVRGNVAKCTDWGKEWNG